MKFLPGREHLPHRNTEHKNIPVRSHILSVRGEPPLRQQQMDLMTHFANTIATCMTYTQTHTIAHWSCSNESKQANVQLTQLQRDVKCAHTLRIRYFVQTQRPGKVTG